MPPAERLAAALRRREVLAGRCPPPPPRLRVTRTARVFAELVVEVCCCAGSAVAAVSEAGRCAVVRDGVVVRRLADAPASVRVQSAFHNRADGALLLLQLSAVDRFTVLRCVRCCDGATTPVFAAAGRLKWPGFVELQRTDLRGLTMSVHGLFVMWDLATYEPLWRIPEGAEDVTMSPGTVTEVRDGRVRVWRTEWDPERDPERAPERAPERDRGAPQPRRRWWAAPPCWEWGEVPVGREFVVSLGPDVLLVKCEGQDCRVVHRVGEEGATATTTLPGTASATQASFLFLYEQARFVHFSQDRDATVHRAHGGRRLFSLPGLRADIGSVCVLPSADVLLACHGRRLGAFSMADGRCVAQAHLGQTCTCIDAAAHGGAVLGTQDGEVWWVND